MVYLVRPPATNPRALREEVLRVGEEKLKWNYLYGKTKLGFWYVVGFAFKFGLK